MGIKWGRYVIEDEKTYLEIFKGQENVPKILFVTKTEKCAEKYVTKKIFSVVKTGILKNLWFQKKNKIFLKIIGHAKKFCLF